LRLIRRGETLIAGEISCKKKIMLVREVIAPGFMMISILDIIKDKAERE